MTITEKISRAKADYDAVYEAGKNAGGGGGAGSYDEGYAAGQKAEYDAFWDTFQDKGKRKSYYNAFNCVSTNGTGWSDTIYNPKYEINCTGDLESGATQLFYWNTLITDTKVPINIQGNNVTRSFYGCVELKRIPSLKVNAQTAWNSSFRSCEKLQDLTIEGTIGQNGFDVSSSTKLSRASIESIMAALSTATNSLTVTLSKTAVNNAFTKDEWEALVSQHANWTISLI